MDRMLEEKNEQTGLFALTPRELEVLQMISSGLTNAEAAKRMQLSVHAIKFHLAGVYRRLGVTNRTEAAVAYLRFMSAPADTGTLAD
jgi:DNA-binding CsgD family transcriptional regulator